MNGFFIARRARAGLLCLLACLVPLQCAAALVRASAGPSHLHAAPVPKPVAVLHDFRRHGAAALLVTERLDEKSRAASRHGHGHGDAERHHHPEAGLAATRVVDAGPDLRDAAEERSGSAASMLLPIPAEASTGPVSTALHARSEAALWVASLRVDAPAERPPRSSAV
jgi:hypothetical protein